jgi:hypothetical protein
VLPGPLIARLSTLAARSHCRQPGSGLKSRTLAGRRTGPGEGLPQGRCPVVGEPRESGRVGCSCSLHCCSCFTGAVFIPLAVLAGRLTASTTYRGKRGQRLQEIFRAAWGRREVVARIGNSREEAQKAQEEAIFMRFLRRLRLIAASLACRRNKNRRPVTAKHWALQADHLISVGTSTALAGRLRASTTYRGKRGERLQEIFGADQERGMLVSFQPGCRS